MSLTPPWLPYDTGSIAIIAASFAVLCAGLLAWTAACLRVAVAGDRLVGFALAAAASALMWSVLCGRQILPMALRPWIETYEWLGVMWEHREFDILVGDGLLWMAAGVSLMIASLGLAAMPHRASSDDEEGAP